MPIITGQRFRPHARTSSPIKIPSVPVIAMRSGFWRLSRVRLGRDQLSNFDPRPFGEAVEEEFRIARMQFEAWDQIPVREVRFAERPAFTTATRNLSKTPIVGSHKTKDAAHPDTGKWWNQQRILARFIRSRCHSQIVKTKIEDQSSAHKIKFAHVFVLIFVNGFEPATMRCREIAIVPLN